jgi:hypothetical protein
MSKKSKPRPGNGARPSVPAPAAFSPAAELDALFESTLASASPEDREALTEQQHGAPPPGTDVVRCWKIARDTQSLLEQRIKRAGEAERLANAARQRAEGERAEIEEQQKRLADDQRAAREETARLKGQRESQDARERELAEREAILVAQEADATAGFAARHREALAGLRAEIGRAQEELGSVREAIGAEQSRWRTEEAQQRVALQAELTRISNEGIQRLESEGSRVREQIEEERNRIEKERARLADEQAEVRAARLELDIAAEMIEIDRAAAKNRVAALVEQQVEEFREREGQARAQLTRMRGEYETLRRRLEERQATDRRFGDRAPEDVLEELDRRGEELERLRADLAARPGAEVRERLARLEAERSAWEAERFQFQATTQRLEADLNRRLVATTEVQRLRDHARALEAHRDLLQQRLAELRGEVESLTAAGRATQVFPAAAGMDEDPALQRAPDLQEEVDLEELVEDLRHRMASGAYSPEPLFYTARDVRTFVAGLAMSRLHVLQGISGTGKTSLPLAFARAAGAGWTLVEVQAGWRSKEDLLGHYNAFEHRFYENDFLQALYRAQTPSFRDRPFLVVLDEMNLSHPEHYFADLLSLLEQAPEHRRLGLLTAPAPNPPRHLLEGRYLKVPENVWIVGTANHDETTREFADKTYDRAHIMELPRSRERFTPEHRSGADPLSFPALEAAFADARETFRDECEGRYRAFEAAFGGPLRELNVSWGNRFERQMQQFYPVVRAAGGTAGEAVDHLLATKLLRKLRDRYALDADRLESVRDLVLERWERIEPGGVPERSVALLEDEIQAKRGSA